MFVQNYQQLPDNFFSKVWPDPMPDSQLLIHNQSLQNQLALSSPPQALLDWLSGTGLAEGMLPLAQKYTGHQFGYYNPDLGDGRGLLLGQWLDETGQYWDFHLKGAGQTPYSRRGDGRAVLRSTIREFLASEALYGLGVPTTRALAIASSPEQVRREVFEPRASLIRVTQSHIRFGHFEWAASQDKDTFSALLDYVFQYHYAELAGSAHSVLELFRKICQKTAQMIAKWQAVGFNHGVMNTDNMSILGETFDFGPYAFFDDFQIGYVCNHSDTEARYAYNEQPKVGLWNCQVLAGAMSHVVDEASLAEALDDYVYAYNQAYLDEMLNKLGLQTEQAGDRQMVADLLVLLDDQFADFSLFFRRLALWQTEREDELMVLISQPKLFKDWFVLFEKRLAKENIEFELWQQRLLSANPSIVLRNYIAQEIIESAELSLDNASEGGGGILLEKWLNILHFPFKEYSVEDFPELAKYQQPAMPNQKGMALSCSS